MPASLLLDMNGDAALHSLALELSNMEISKSFAKLGGLQQHDDVESSSSSPFDDPTSPSSLDPPVKKSANMTAECVEVPTSEHVAEIVGRQGQSPDPSIPGSL
jgi:hypothetical protein